MILCITPNPAIDRTIILPSLVLGNVHRAQKTIVAAGGKGLNVARTIRRLGGEVLCMGFAGGHAGHLLEDLAKNEGLHSSWTWTNVETRICTILVSQNGDATVINEPGMPVSTSDWERLEQDIHEQIPSAGLVCISGSFPPDTSDENLQRLLDMLVAIVDSGKQVWVDTSGAALLKVLTHPNVCVKVNGNEIGEVLGVEVRDLGAAKSALKMLGEHGLKACAITLGEEGALLVTKEGRWHAYGPRVRVVSTVGSGDAFLGGLVNALDCGKIWPEALREAVAVGSANTLSVGGGEFALHEFKDIREQIQVQVW
jgi:1-phosphofructokinase family hexose kinase